VLFIGDDMLRACIYKNDLVIIDLIKDEFHLAEDVAEELNTDLINLKGKTRNKIPMLDQLILITPCEFVLEQKQEFLEERWLMPTASIKRHFTLDTFMSLLHLKYCIYKISRYGFNGIVADLATLRAKVTDFNKNEKIVEKYIGHMELVFPLIKNNSNCLSYSYFLARRLLLSGVNAQLVVGVRTRPFYSHAWVEVDGEVANDDKNISKKLSVILKA